jgi:hypothetical protein
MTAESRRQRALRPSERRIKEFSETGIAGKGVVMSRLRGSEYYHRRADELRQAAREPRSSANRDTLLSFTADFDGLADEAECAEQAQPEKAVAR